MILSEKNIEKMKGVKKMYSKYFAILLISSLLLGCVSSKKINYFQDTENQIQEELIVNFEPMLQIGDILFINVSTLEQGASAPFNLFESVILGNQTPLPYLVDFAGEINFPVLGKIKVTEFTTKKLIQHLTKKLEIYLKDPIVNIRIINFKITVLGEVIRPGTYQVANERISVIEALGLAGDLSIYGKRESVILIREQNGKRTYINLDLTSKELFNSPYFYLSQNDTIYVESNKTRVNSSRVGPNTSVLISSLSIIISLVAVLLR